MHPALPDTTSLPPAPLDIYCMPNACLLHLLYLEIPEADLQVEQSISWYLELQEASSAYPEILEASSWYLEVLGCLEVEEVSSVYLEVPEA